MVRVSDFRSCSDEWNLRRPRNITFPPDTWFYYTLPSSSPGITPRLHLFSLEHPCLINGTSDAPTADCLSLSLPFSQRRREGSTYCVTLLFVLRSTSVSLALPTCVHSFIKYFRRFLIYRHLVFIFITFRFSKFYISLLLLEILRMRDRVG